MDDRHFNQLVRWLENNVDVEAGMPLIFDDYLQERIEKELRGE